MTEGPSDTMTPAQSNSAKDVIVSLDSETVTVTGVPALTITNALDVTAQDIDAAAYSDTTSISNDYLVDRAEFNFSTTAARDIKFTTADGTIIWEETGNIDTHLFIDFNDRGFNASENITVNVSDPGSACLMDLIFTVKEGTATIGGNPVLGAGTAVIGKVDLNNVDFSAFGELSTIQITPIVQLQFPYNINAALVTGRANQSGSVDVNTNMARLQTGAAAASSGEILSVVPVKYNPGQGGLVRFTAVYTTGAADSEQLAGIGDTGDGYFFGYNGTAFSTLIRRSGVSEVRTLTVATASSTAEDITITLNSNAKTDVTVTASGNKTTTANEIAAADYSDVGRGWTTEAVGDTVIFVSWCAGARTGTYTLGGAATAVGSFASTLAGGDDTQTFTAQASWNVDVMDGTGSSGVTLDPTKGNVYQIQYQWLGFGASEYAIENPTTGRVIIVHRVAYANTNTRPSVDNPTLPLYAGALNKTAGNTTNLTLNIGSMMGAIEGKEELLGPRRGTSGDRSDISTTELPVLTIRNKLVYQGKLNRTKVKINFAAVSTEHSKPVIVRIRGNPTLTDASFSDVSTNTSVIQKDTSASATTGGVELLTLELAKVDSEIIDALSAQAILLPGNEFTITGEASSGSGAEVDVSFNWAELF
jgi:hypothetical protein